MALSRRLLDIVSFILASLLVVSGLLGIFTPLSFARNVFAIPTATEESVIFYPGLAVRNFSAGLTVFALSFTKQRRALGMLVMCWLWVGVVDTWICLSHPDAQNTWIHVFNICWISVFGWNLLSY